MRVLVVGSGGREHSLAWKLAQEAEVLVAPGNPGIGEVAECLSLRQEDFVGIEEAAKSKAVSLVVVGPEAPLIAGLADRLREAGIPTLGPGQAGAMLESSKVFSKALMQRAGVPTAGFEAFEDAQAASTFARRVYAEGRQLAVKASGPALGKGVAVCGTLDEALGAIQGMLVERRFGDSGSTIVLEERLVGREFSLLALCSGESYRCLPPAQDYKRAYDGDKGPNTGGMGSFSPVPWVTDELLMKTQERVIEPTLRALKGRGIDYRGVLYAGLMVRDEDPYCLEFNVRFGDPETQSLMPRMGKGFADALLSAARGDEVPECEVLPNAAVSVVLASKGYPGPVEGGALIAYEKPSRSDVAVFQAGTRLVEGKLVTSGGRVAAVTAIAPTVREAREKAYGNLGCFRFEGAEWRRDIAAG
jgi:phosphoribosylamine--glycine ligase